MRALSAATIAQVILLGLSGVLTAATWIRFRADTWVKGREGTRLAVVWLAGSFFGLALGVQYLDGFDLVLAIGAISGGAFLLAVILAEQIGRLFVLHLFSDRKLSTRENIQNLLVVAGAGVVPGAVGALTVSVALKCVAGVGLQPWEEATEAVVGAACGVLFVLLGIDGHNHRRLLLAFLTWQIPVGLLVGSNVAAVPVAQRSAVFIDQFRSFLGGPTVELIALIGSIASIFALVLMARRFDRPD